MELNYRSPISIYKWNKGLYYYKWILRGESEALKLRAQDKEHYIKKSTLSC